jgi:hypothetical protein
MILNDGGLFALFMDVKNLGRSDGKFLLSLILDLKMD